MEELIGLSHSGRPDRVADVILVPDRDGDARTLRQVGRSTAGSWLDRLGAELPEVGFWSVAYDARSMVGKGPKMLPLHNRAVSVLALLDIHGIGSRPIVFIARGLGELLVKQVLRTASELPRRQWKAVAEQARGVVFLEAPHGGSRWADAVRRIVLRRPRDTVRELVARNSHLRELDRWYRDHHEVLQLKTVVVNTESGQVRAVRFADEGSSDPRLPGISPIPPDDHPVSISEPGSRESRLDRGVGEFIRDCVRPGAAPLPSSAAAARGR